MKMFTATRVAALAVGLSLAGAQAIAAPNDDHRRGDDNNSNTATQQQNDNDRGDRDHKKKPKTAPTGNTAPVVAPVVQAAPQTQTQTNNWQNNDHRGTFGNKNDGKNWGKQDRRRQVDVTRYNRNFAAPRRYHAGTYRQPYGYAYRRYSYGQYLPNSYYGRNFWLANFLTYGLFAPPPGYIWVRYGPDALLIDEETGEIVQVRYNMFYS